MKESVADILIYQSQGGEIKIDVRLEDETVWLTQEQMGQLFGKARSTITGHIGNIFKEGELVKKEVCRDFQHTTQHGAIAGKQQTQTDQCYNLDVAGQPMINDIGLAALTLLVAESVPNQKDTIIKLIMNLLCDSELRYT